jgi:hypothetical protein
LYSTTGKPTLLRRANGLDYFLDLFVAARLSIQRVRESRDHQVAQSQAIRFEAIDHVS